MSTRQEQRGRGQTPQDFTLGVAILLVTVIATFGFVQNSLVATYQQPVDGDLEESAERLATYLVSNFSVDGNDRVLRYDRADGLDETLDADTGLSRLRTAAGLAVDSQRRTNASLNVTVVGSASLRNQTRRPAVGTDGDPLTWGETYRTRQSAVEVTRVVTLEDHGGRCESACLLVVRVW